MKYLMILSLVLVGIISAKEYSAIHICTQEAYSITYLDKSNHYQAGGATSFKKPKVLKYIQVRENGNFKQYVEVNGEKMELKDLGEGTGNEVYFYTKTKYGIMFHTLHQAVNNGFRWTYQMARSHLSEDYKTLASTNTFTCITVHNTLFDDRK